MLQTQNPYSRERIDALTTMLAGMDARGRQAYAAQHRNDPAVVATAVHVNNIVKAAERSKAMQAGGPMPTVVDQNIAAMTPAPAPAPMMAQTQLPEDQGIARIPTPNMRGMADGGIAGYEDDEEGMATGGMGGMFNFAQQSEPVVRMAGGGMAPYIPGYRDTGRVVDYRQAIIDEAQMQGVPAAVALQISGVESNFNPKARPIDPKTGKPRSSATSFFQVIDETFKGLGGDPKKRNDPMENIRVGVKYLAQNQAALTKQLGRPPKPQELYATHFLGTETGSKLLSADPSTPISAFLDKADPRNKDKILTANPEVLGGKKTVGDVLAWTQKKMAPVLTSAIPIGSAVAETPPKAGITDLVSQIPGSKVAPPAPGQKDRYITGNQGVIGAGETALQYLTGTLAIPTAGGAAVLEQVPNMLSGIFGSGKGIDRAELEKSFRDKAAQVTYEPRTVGGRTVSESTAKTLEDLKVPSYLARIGSGASVRRPSAGAADVKALAKEAAATAAEKTKTADTLRLPPPSEQGIAGLAKGAETILVDSQGNALPPKTPPAVPPVKGAARAAQEGERVATGDRLLNLAKDKAEAAEARKAAESWAKAEEATTKADAQNLLADERFGQTNRAQGIATLTGATPAAISESNAATEAANAAAAATPFKGVDANELQRMQEANQAPMTRDDIVKAAEEATPAKERKGFSNDDLLTLGLNLLASKSPNFMTALGEAGLATVAGKKEREKLAREQTMIDTELGYKKAKTKEAEASAALIERGGKEKNLELQAEQMIYDNLGKWEKTTAGQMALMNDPTAKAREESRLRTAIYASLGLKNIMPTTSASSGVGLSASDSALINKYLR
jgi:hypothetical protein